jgi:hypothetical protein
MTTQTILDQICQFFGGPYDSAQRIYHQSPQLVTGVYTVKRAWWKQEDNTAYLLGASTGTRSGCALIVQIEDGTEERETPGQPGIKKAAHAVSLHGYVRSTEAYAEDAQDFAYGIKDALIARIHADRTCGSGGFEVGGFQVGEGGSPWIRWRVRQGRTTAELTKIYVGVYFEAHEYLQA